MALLSHSLKLIYIHVPKTGGSSVTAALEPHLAASGPIPVGHFGWQPQRHTSNLHDCWANMEEWAQRLLDRGYRLIAGTRNPWDRVASFWHYYVDFHSRYRARQSTRDLAEFLMMNDAQRGQTKWTWDRISDIIGPADPVLRFESLVEDWDALGLGIDLPHENPRHRMVGSREADWSDTSRIDPPWTEETIEKVREMFAPDIERWGYEVPEAILA